MKPIIVYYTRTGNTEKLAQKIAEDFEVPYIHQIKDLKKRSGSWGFLKAGYHANRKSLTNIEPKTVSFDKTTQILIIGQPIWSSRPTPAIRTLLHNLGKNTLEDSKCALFTTCISGGMIKNAKLNTEILESYGANVLGYFNLTSKHGWDEKTLANYEEWKLKIKDAL